MLAPKAGRCESRGSFASQPAATHSRKYLRATVTGSAHGVHRRNVAAAIHSAHAGAAKACAVAINTGKHPCQGLAVQLQADPEIAVCAAGSLRKVIGLQQVLVPQVTRRRSVRDAQIYTVLEGAVSRRLCTDTPLRKAPTSAARSRAADSRLWACTTLPQRCRMCAQAGATMLWEFRIARIGLR